MMKIDLIIQPIIIIYGTIGNILMAIIFRRKKFRKHSIGTYLFVYSIINLLYLHVIYGTSWIISINNYPLIETFSDWCCRIWQLVIRLIMHSGIWILVAAIMDRYITIRHPLLATTYSTVFMSKIATLVVLIAFTVINIHAMWVYELKDDTYCESTDTLHYYIWNWVNAFLSAYIPLTILLVMSGFLSFALIMRSGQSVNNDVTFDLSKTVLALTVFYLLFSLPATIANIVIFTSQTSFHLDPKLLVAHEITALLTYANPSCAVFVCLVFSSSFREECANLWLCLLKCCRQNDGELKILTDIHSVHLEDDRKNSETEV